jgi:hypothetical protein
VATLVAEACILALETGLRQAIRATRPAGVSNQ